MPGNPNQQVRVEAVSGTLMVVSGWLVKRGFLLLVRYALARIQKQSAGTVPGEEPAIGGRACLGPITDQVHRPQGS